jgi:hypothetical protein
MSILVCQSKLTRYYVINFIMYEKTILYIIYIVRNIQAKRSRSFKPYRLIPKHMKEFFELKL